VSADAQPGHRVALGDWLACAARGAQEPAARAASAAADGLLERVAAAGTAGHVLDFDDTYLPGIAHLSAPTAPAALVLGAERGAKVGEVLAAFAAGFEAMGALSRASHPALYDRGWHPTAVCGGLGAAVAASRLLGLDRAQERAAAALALLRAGGLRSGFGSAGKSVGVGLAAATGVACARLAAAGVACDLERIGSGPAGFEAAFGATVAESRDGPAIDENWIKAYPCCLQTHSAIEAALQAAEEGLLAAGLDGDRGGAGGAVVVAVHPLSRQAAPIDAPADGLEAKFSIPYLAAFALLRGAPGVDDFEALDPEALRLAEQVSVRTDHRLGESEAVLEVEGRAAARVEAALGSPQRPLDESQLAGKRRALAGSALDGALQDPGLAAAEVLRAAGLR
jgi:2-methylcitrate dehydratase PrpD